LDKFLATTHHGFNVLKIPSDNGTITVRYNKKDALHAGELPSEALGEVVRVFFSNMEIPPLSRVTCLIYCMKNEEASLITAGLSKFNKWGAFMDDRVVPRPQPSTLATESEQDSSVREPNPSPFEDLDDNNKDSEGGTKIRLPPSQHSGAFGFLHGQQGIHGLAELAYRRRRYGGFVEGPRRGGTPRAPGGRAELQAQR
jgi:hypothetical protein